MNTRDTIGGSREGRSSPTQQPFSRTKPRLLLFGAPVLVLLTIAAAPLLGRTFGSLPSAICLWGLYVVGAWGLALAAGPRRELRALYETPIHRKPFELVLTWAPVVATFGIVFLRAAPQLGFPILVAIGAVAVVNGLTEELLWRGTFVATFPDHLPAAYLYPTCLFAAWHIALALLPNVRYEGGAAALVGGSAVMGFGWGWVVWRTRDLRSVTIAHILTNLFAFSGLALSNWVVP
ncbi:MAG: CPBP family intramembrane metalloprotease [Holophagales bacterium]|nr:CPBP family intramembrane metalloprotease [Holophagales bacterium]